RARCGTFARRTRSLPGSRAHPPRAAHQRRSWPCCPGARHPRNGKHPGAWRTRPSSSIRLTRESRKMIPRTLVPPGSRLPDGDVPATQRRRPTAMDERTLVPAMLPIIELDGRSSIPRSLPLESIAARVVVPRDVNQEAYNVRENTSTPVQPTDMDERIAVPQGGAPLEMTEGRLIPPADIV